MSNIFLFLLLYIIFSKELWFESQLILNDFDSAAIAGVDQLCEPSVLRLGERGRGRGGGRGRERGRVGEGESYSLATIMNRFLVGGLSMI